MHISMTSSRHLQRGNVWILIDQGEQAIVGVLPAAELHAPVNLATSASCLGALSTRGPSLLMPLCMGTKAYHYSKPLSLFCTRKTEKKRKEEGATAAT